MPALGPPSRPPAPADGRVGLCNRWPSRRAGPRGERGTCLVQGWLVVLREPLGRGECEETLAVPTGGGGHVLVEEPPTRRGTWQRRGTRPQLWLRCRFSQRRLRRPR